MVEIAIPIALAAVTGLSVLTSRMYNRIHELDKRVDQVELRVAEQLDDQQVATRKSDLEGMLDRVRSVQSKVLAVYRTVIRLGKMRTDSIRATLTFEKT